MWYNFYVLVVKILFRSLDIDKHKYKLLQNIFSNQNPYICNENLKSLNINTLNTECKTKSIYECTTSNHRVNYSSRR